LTGDAQPFDVPAIRADKARRRDPIHIGGTICEQQLGLLTPAKWGVFPSTPKKKKKYGRRFLENFFYRMAKKSAPGGGQYESDPPTPQVLRVF
jgi:hypothetical protein